MGAASVERSERVAIAEFGAGGRGSKVGRPLADGERGGVIIPSALCGRRWL